MQFQLKFSERVKFLLEISSIADNFHNYQLFVELNGEVLSYHETHELLQVAVTEGKLSLQEGQEVDRIFQELQHQTYRWTLAARIPYGVLEDLVYRDKTNVESGDIK